MPYLITWAHSCSAMILPMWTWGFKNNQIATPVKIARQQTTPELSWTFRNTGILRNPPEPSGNCLRNLHQHKFRKLPPEPTPAHTGTLQNLPEPSGSCLRNLHQHTLEPSGTFRKLPPEPTPAHTGTLRNLPEIASGTYTSTHRNPPDAGTLRNLPEVISGTYTNIRWNPSEPSGSLHQHLHRNPPEPSGTCLRHLHQHAPELSGTFWNLPPEPAPQTRTGTHRSLSGLKTPLAFAVGEKKGGFQTPLKPLWNHHWTPRDELGEAVCSKTGRRDRFLPISSRHMTFFGPFLTSWNKLWWYPQQQ